MLFRKMMREIRAGKAQFVAIFLMIFLGVFIYTGVNSDWNGMKVSSEKFYSATNLADVWVYGAGFTKDDIQKLEKREEIESVARRASFETFEKDNKEKKITLFLSDNHTVSQMKVIEGKAFRTERDGLWIDQSYAEQNQLKIGQSLTLEWNGLSIEKKIMGFIMHPEMVYQSGDDSILPNHKNSGYAFLSANHVPFKEQIPFTQLLIKAKDSTEMEGIVRDTLGKSNLTFVLKKDMPSYATFQSEIEQHKAFSEVFPIVFLLIAILTTMTTVSKMVVNQRLQIGILKAFGFRNRKITLHYLSHVIVIVCSGAAFGFVLGPIVVPAILFPMMKAIYVLPELKAATVSGSIYVILGAITACFLVAFLVCHKQLKEKPADALRPAVVRYKKKKDSSGKLWSHLSFYAQWNIRDVSRNKIRSLIAVLGVAGCMGLMTCAFGMKNSLDHMIYMMFHKLSTYEMRVTIDESADYNSILQKTQGSLVGESVVELQMKGLKKTGSLMIQEDTRYLKLQNEDSDMIALPEDGIALSYNIAKEYDLEIGDSILWREMGKNRWIKSMIKEVIHTPSSQGITISKEEYLKTGETFVPCAVVGKKADVTSIQGVTNIQYLDKDIKSSMDTMMEGMNLMIGILIFGAVVLGIVVLYNIGTFSYFEKMREMATLKVLGFRNQQVKQLLLQQNLWLTVSGILLGIPLGYALIYTVISTVGTSMDISIVIEPITHMGCSLGTLLVSVLVMNLVTKKVKQIDMVSALKAME